MLVILGLGIGMIIAMSSLTKSFVFKMVLVRPFSNSSDFMRVLEKLRFRDGLLSVDGRPNRRGEAPLLYSSGVVWTGP